MDAETFRPGDRAVYRFGGRDVEVDVLEDPLGIEDALVVYIRVPLMDAEPLEFAVMREHLNRVESAA
jgi:hypothetical protein